MNFAAFKAWRERSLQENPKLLDCAETNLYHSLASLQPAPVSAPPDHRVHRCDLARLWLARYGFPATASRRALVCRGVRHALALIFAKLAKKQATLWLPRDVYPVYGELAHAAGIQPKLFKTLPEPILPHHKPEGIAEYLLIANPWKPLGRYLTDKEYDELARWLAASPARRLLMDCVYDLNRPFHDTTLKLQETGQAILLHSVTKGWLCPQTFGVVLTGEEQTEWESAFRADAPSQDLLSLAEELLSHDANLPELVATALAARKKIFLVSVPASVRESMLIDPVNSIPGGYFFPVNMKADELLLKHNLVGIPASVFGSDWEGSILTSLGAAFSHKTEGVKS